MPGAGASSSTFWHRAVAFEQRDRAAVRVAEHLDLHMPGPGDVPLDQHRVVAEGRGGLALARPEHRVELARAAHDAHALAAAARARLDQHRVSDAIGFGREQPGVLVGAVIAGNQRHAGLSHQALGLGLQAHRPDC
jgi:hypothetical protein